MNRCGTSDGYNDHVRASTMTCRDCCDAQAIYMRRLRRRVMLGLPLKGDNEHDVTGGRYDDLAQAGAVFRTAVVMGA